MLTGYNTFRSSGGLVFDLYNTAIDGLGRLTAGDECLTRLDNAIIGHGFSFDYDGLSQLTNAVGFGGAKEYVYQNNGNMTSRTVQSNPTSFTYFGNEMLTAGGISLSYDENGNMTAAPKDALTSMTLEYNWDNKLRKATIGSDSISLRYDPSGNRIYKSSVSLYVDICHG